MVSQTIWRIWENTGKDVVETAQFQQRHSPVRYRLVF
jgi:hypothetical protein